MTRCYRALLNCVFFLFVAIGAILILAGTIESQKMFSRDFNDSVRTPENKTNYQWGLFQLRVCLDKTCTDYDYQDLPDNFNSPNLVIPDDSDGYDSLFQIGVAFVVLIFLGFISGIIGIVLALLWSCQIKGKLGYTAMGGFCCAVAFFIVSIIVWSAAFPFYDSSPNPSSLNPNSQTNWAGDPDRDLALVIVGTILICICTPIYFGFQVLIDKHNSHDSGNEYF